MHKINHKMKLEIKHLAPYLPYGLKLSVPKIYDDFVCELVVNNNTNSYKNGMSINTAIENDAKPILRNLSDLTKEIEVNGEKFVPIEELSDLICQNNMGYNDHYISYELNEHIIEIDWLKEPYFIVEQLLKWHFNVFNLPENLYIDINTLNNQ